MTASPPSYFFATESTYKFFLDMNHTMTLSLLLDLSFSPTIALVEFVRPFTRQQKKVSHLEGGLPCIQRLSR